MLLRLKQVRYLGDSFGQCPMSSAISFWHYVEAFGHCKALVYTWCACAVVLSASTHLFLANKCELSYFGVGLTGDACDCRGMFSKEVIGKMKKGAYLVNNARGAIVDREAVVEACKSGQLGGERQQSFPSELVCQSAVKC